MVVDELTLTRLVDAWSEPLSERTRYVHMCALRRFSKSLSMLPSMPARFDELAARTTGEARAHYLDLADRAEALALGMPQIERQDVLGALQYLFTLDPAHAQTLLDFFQASRLATAEINSVRRESSVLNTIATAAHRRGMTPTLLHLRIPVYPTAAAAA